MAESVEELGPEPGFWYLPLLRADFLIPPPAVPGRGWCF